MSTYEALLIDLDPLANKVPLPESPQTSISASGLPSSTRLIDIETPLKSSYKSHVPASPPRIVDGDDHDQVAPAAGQSRKPIDLLAETPIAPSRAASAKTASVFSKSNPLLLFGNSEFKISPPGAHPSISMLTISHNASKRTSPSNSLDSMDLSSFEIALNSSRKIDDSDEDSDSVDGDDEDEIESKPTFNAGRQGDDSVESEVLAKPSHVGKGTDANKATTTGQHGSPPQSPEASSKSQLESRVAEARAMGEAVEEADGSQQISACVEACGRPAPVTLVKEHDEGTYPVREDQATLDGLKVATFANPEADQGSKRSDNTRWTESHFSPAQDGKGSHDSVMSIPKSQCEGVNQEPTKAKDENKTEIARMSSPSKAMTSNFLASLSQGHPFPASPIRPPHVSEKPMSPERRAIAAKFDSIVMPPPASPRRRADGTRVESDGDLRGQGFGSGKVSSPRKGFEQIPGPPSPTPPPPRPPLSPKRREAAVGVAGSDPILSSPNLSKEEWETEARAAAAAIDCSGHRKSSPFKDALEATRKARVTSKASLQDDLVTLRNSSGSPTKWEDVTIDSSMDLMGDSSFLAAANVSLGDDSFHVVGGAKVQASRGTRPGSAKCGSHPFLGGGRRQPPNSDRLPDPRTNARFQRESEGATSKRDSQNGKPASSVPTTDPQGKTAVRKKMEEKKEDRNGLGIGWANDSVDLSLTGRNVSHSNIFDESGERSLLFGSSFLSDVEGGSLAKAVEKQANGKEKGGKEDDGRGRRFTEREEKLSCSTSSDASFRSVETVTETDWRNGRSRSGSNASNLSNTSSIARPSGISRSESSSSVSSSSTVIVETGATPETQMRSKNPSCAAALPEAKTRRLSSVSATPSRIRGISKPPVSGTASRRESLIAQTQLQALESGLMATPVATLRGTVGTKSRRSSSPIGLGRTPTLSRREVKEKGETDATPLASRRIQSWQIDAVEVKATSSTPLTNRRSNSSSGSRTDLTTSTSRISRGSPLVHPRKSAPTIPSSRSSTSLITPSSSNSSISSIGTVTESTAATSGPRSRLGGLTSSRSVKPSIHQTTGLPRKLEPTTTSSIPAPTATSYLPKSSSGTLSSTRRPPSSSSLKQTEIGTRLARTKTTISKHDPVPTPTAPHSLSEQVLKESKSNNPPPPKRNEPNHQPLSKPKLPTTTTRVGGAIARSRSTAIPQRTKFGGGGGQGEEGEGERGKENRKEADSKSSEVMKTTIVSPPIPTSSSDGRAPSTGQSSSSSTPREVQVDRGRIAFGYRRRA